MIDISGTRRHDLIVTLQRKIEARKREIDRLEKEIAVVKSEISTGIRPAIDIHHSKLKRILRSIAHSRRRG